MAVACPLCHAPETSLLATVGDVELHTSSECFDYRNCTACDAIFIDPMPLERLGEIYPDTYYSNAAPAPSLLEAVKSYLDSHLLRRVLREIPGDRLAVLDVGGGSGWMLNLARRADARVAHTAVVDLNETARAPAELAGHEFHRARIEDFRAPRKYDLVLMLNLIEHVAEPARVLAKMRDLLSDGGRVLIKTPNTRTWDRYLFQNSYWGGYHCPRHWILFNPDNFARLADDSGLRVAHFRYTQGAPQWAASVLGVLTQRNWIRLDRDRPMHRHPLLPLLLALFAAFDFSRARFFPTAQMILVLERAGPGQGHPGPGGV